MEYVTGDGMQCYHHYHIFISTQRMQSIKLIIDNYRYLSIKLVNYYYNLTPPPG